MATVKEAAEDLARRSGLVPGGDIGDLLLAVWDGGEGHPHVRFTLTRSANEPGWQLTEWDTLDFAYGHEVVDRPLDVLDPRIQKTWADDMGHWFKQETLRQVAFSDGRVLVREGAGELQLNPRRERNPVSAGDLVQRLRF